jgi:RNA polymerase sigma-70 factor (ECF subfamily)
MTAESGMLLSIVGSSINPADQLPREAGEVTRLLQLIGNGDSSAADRLLPMVLGELHNLAKHYMARERPGHTLQPTALVNEAYLRLLGDQARNWQNRAHFVGVAASLMRRILVDYARRRRAGRRGSDCHPVPFDEEVHSLSAEQSEELLGLDAALDELEKASPRHRQVVELRYFGGLSVEETACALGVSGITVKRDWLAARAWLKGRLRSQASGLA